MYSSDKMMLTGVKTRAPNGFFLVQALRLQHVGSEPMYENSLSLSFPLFYLGSLSAWLSASQIEIRRLQKKNNNSRHPDQHHLTWMQKSKSSVMFRQRWECVLFNPMQQNALYFCDFTPRDSGIIVGNTSDELRLGETVLNTWSVPPFKPGETRKNGTFDTHIPQKTNIRGRCQVKPLLGTPTSDGRALAQVRAIPCLLRQPATASGKAVDSGSNTCGSAVHVGDLDRVPSSWLTVSW